MVIQTKLLTIKFHKLFTIALNYNMLKFNDYYHRIVTHQLKYYFYKSSRNNNDFLTILNDMFGWK